MSFKLCYFFLALTIGVNSFAQKDSSVPRKKKIYENKGSSYTLISHQEIEANFGKTLAGLLNEQAGIVVSGAYQPMGSFTNLYMEGCLGGKVLILLNGIPIWDPSSISDTYFDLNFISLNEIEEILIYRGAQSTIYGSGALVGVINIVTLKKKLEKAVDISVVAGAGNESAKTLDAKLWGTKDKVNYSLGYSSFGTDGFSYAQDTTGKNNFDLDGFKSYLYNTQLEYKPTDKLSITAYYLHNKYKADSDEEGFIDTKNFYYTNTLVNKGLSFKYAKNNLSLIGNYNLCNSIRDYHYSSSNSEYVKGTAKFANLIMQTSFKKSISLTIGIDYRSGKFYNSFYDSLLGASQNKYPATYQYGVYTTINYQNRDSSYLLVLGFRANDCKQTKMATSLFINNSYRLNNLIEIFANISKGYLTPSIYQSYDSSIGNNNLLDETILSSRLGIEVTTSTSTHKVSYFQNNLKNGIDFNSNTGAYSNCYTLTSWGFEYETKLHLSTHFLLLGNYTYLAGNEKDISRQNFSDTVSYSYLIRRPKSVVNCTLTYKEKYSSISLSSRYVSSYYDIGLATNDFKLNGFVLFNLNASLAISNRIGLLVGIQNIANRTFHDTRGYNSIPFTAICGIKVSL